MLDLHKPLFDDCSPWTGMHDGKTHIAMSKDKSKGRGRWRIITAEASLGLVLSWYRFRGAEWALQGWFGFTGGHTNVWLRFGRRMLLKCLSEHPEAKVKFPTDEEVERLKDTT